MTEHVDFGRVREQVRKALPHYRRLLETRLAKNHACVQMVVDARMLEIQHAVDFLDTEFQWADMARKR